MSVTTVTYELTTRELAYNAKSQYALDYNVDPQRQGLVYIIETGNAVPVPSIPVNTILPAITGTVRSGETLTCSTGTWTNSPSSYAYQWTRDGANIGGATSSTYTVEPGDIPTLLACVVIATNGAGDSLPATAASVSSPLRAIYQIDASARVWVHTQGTGVAVATPVETWTSADGLYTLLQTVTSRRPTREVDGVDFDGIASELLGDAHASILNDAYTVCTGFHDVNNASSSTRQLWGNYTHFVSTSTRRCSHVNFSRPGAPSTTRQRYLLGANSSATVISLAGLSALGAAGPYDLAFRSPDPGTGTAEAVELEDPLASVASGAWGTVDQVNNVHTLGSQRLNTVFAASLWWEGTVRYHILIGIECSDAQLDTIRDALAAEGVL